VNITKFGAFVNILPGTDGLLHIYKIGGGRRIDRVEDVLSLGDVVKVRVDDIDPNGKLSLTPVDLGDDDGGGSDDRSSERSSGSRSDSGRSDSGRSDSGRSDSRSSGADDEGRSEVSFEDSFDATAKEEFGDLGPKEERRGNRGGGGDRGRGRGRGNGRRR
jgi:polyribonucleotide nucleotidyltransferase